MSIRFSNSRNKADSCGLFGVTSIDAETIEILFIEENLRSEMQTFV